MQDRHLEEQLNRRSMYLRLRRRIWIIPAAMAAGALLCFLIYTLVIVTVYGQRQYRETATYEVNFAYNEETGKAYDYYNAATWQGLIFTHPQIADTVSRELPEGMDMETASEDTKADLISDIRYLTVEVTTPSEADTRQLSAAIRDGLEHFGDEAKEFDSIEFLSATEPALVVVSDRSRNAALLGMVLGLLISWAALYLHTLLDDAVYVPEDAQKRYGYPVLGVLAGSGDTTVRAGIGNRASATTRKTEGRPHAERTGEGHTVKAVKRTPGTAATLPLMLRRQLPMNFAHALEGKSRVLLMSLYGSEDAKRLAAALQQALSDAGARENAAIADTGTQAAEAFSKTSAGVQGAEVFSKINAVTHGGEVLSKINAGTHKPAHNAALHCGFVPTGPADDPAYDSVNHTCSDVILIIHYAREQGPRMENFLSTLAQQGYHVIGLLLCDADARFLQAYYTAS